MERNGEERGREGKGEDWIGEEMRGSERRGGREMIGDGYVTREERKGENWGRESEIAIETWLLTF